MLHHAQPRRRQPRLGAVALRRLMARPLHRRLLAAGVALLIAATAAHHILPEHSSMGMAGMGHDHATTVMVACLGTIEAAFILAYVSGVARLRRMRAARPPHRRTRAMRVPRPTGRPPCRDGPPPFLRLQVLRT